MSKFDWVGTTRVCYCGAEFTPKTYHQVNCCTLHAYIKKVAQNSKFGRKMLKEHPEQVITHYSWIK